MSQQALNLLQQLTCKGATKVILAGAEDILFEYRITFTFNYKDGAKTINFTELEKLGLNSDIDALTVPNRVVIRDFTYDHSIFILIRFY